MKDFKLSKLISVGVILLSTALLFFTLSACGPTPVTTIPPTTIAPVAPRVVYTDGGFDWGLLGLLGLLGLGGLTGVTKRRNTDINNTRY